MTTALYLRISSEDIDLRTGEKDESESISNQRNLLREYVRSHTEFASSEIIEFCDDGWSGTNFERPAVKELLEKVKHGQIDCIVVKDDCVNIELNSEGLENTGFCEVSSVF